MTTPTIPSALEYRVLARKTPGRSSTFELGNETLEVDTSPTSADVLPGPADLLAAAFAACILKNVDRFSKILPFIYSEAEVDVIVERQEAPPRMRSVRYVLRITTDEAKRRVDLLHRNIISHGTVFNTLAAACDVEGKIIAVPANV